MAVVDPETNKVDPSKTNGGKRAGSGAKKGSGGRRVGAGRPKGTKNVKTILKEEAMKEEAKKNALKKELYDMLPDALKRSDRALQKALAEINAEEVEETFKKRIALHSNQLLTAMLTAAMGQQFLYKITTAIDSKGKVKKTHVQVRDPDEIREYLDNPMKTEGQDYYYISETQPDITAINSLLDRMMGRPTTKVVGPKNSDGSEGPIKVLSVNYSLPAPEPAEAVVEQVVHEAIEE
jgi:hypothetical protein